MPGSDSDLNFMCMCVCFGVRVVEKKDVSPHWCLSTRVSLYPNQLVSMRSFVESADQYSIQFDYNQNKDKMASTLLPACQLRLLSVTGDGATMDTPSGQPATQLTNHDGFYHMNRLTEALNSLDNAGWRRSYHQREFHLHYAKACARVFFKTEPPGAFERAHKKILEINGWDVLSQEILISTPRRFGKTISISLFCAALVFACPAVEISIYSTCKRISQKLLRNVCKFLELIYIQMKVTPFQVIRKNQEELHIFGPEGHGDQRTVSSYPSKVYPPPTNTPHTTLHYTTPHNTTHPTNTPHKDTTQHYTTLHHTQHRYYIVYRATQ
jgi:hypothetical protein